MPAERVVRAALAEHVTAVEVAEAAAVVEDVANRSKIDNSEIVQNLRLFCVLWQDQCKTFELSRHFVF